MARALRVEFPGAWYHVTARGNERRAIFRVEADRVRFLELLGECSSRFGVRVHGYVLMTNHYHLIVETPDGGLSRALQWLNVSYSVWFNRRHRRSGHLFQGRFKAIVVDWEEWGAQLSRYVHLNPVRLVRFGLGKRERAEQRAGFSEGATRELIAARRRALREFRWSSYRAYTGLEKPLPWLCVGQLRGLVGGGRARAGATYGAYVEEALRDGLIESPLERVEAQLILGGERLAERIRRLIGGKQRREESGVRVLQRRGFAEVIKAVTRLKGEPWEAFRDRYGDWGRDLALWLGRTHCGLSLCELGRSAGGIDYATVSVAVTRWRERTAKDRRLTKLQRQAVEMLNAKM